MFWDDKQMVIYNIRHSFVTGDNTGICEMIIVDEEMDIFHSKQRKPLGPQPIDERSGNSHIPDLSRSVFDPIGVTQHLTGRTSKQVIKDPIKRPVDTECLNVSWSDNFKPMSAEEKEEMFCKKEIKITSETKTSCLTRMVEDSLKIPSNPFLSYARFDAEGVGGTCETLAINIFVTIYPTKQERLQPMFVEYFATATVRDLIGLVLFKIVQEARHVLVQTDVKAYSLHIASEDGEVEPYCHALDASRPMKTFGFNYLSLYGRDGSTTTSPTNVTVTIYLPQEDGYSVVKVDNTDVKMKQVFAKLVKKRVVKKNGRGYHLEKQSRVGVPIDLETTLESTGTMTFNFVKNNSSNQAGRRSTHVEASNSQREITSLKYKLYRVLMLQRMLPSVEVDLGIHGQKIEIDPVSQVKSQFWSKIKPFSLNIDSIEDCLINENNQLKQPTDRTLVRIYFKTAHQDLKHYEFECTRENAEEIHYKILNILKTCPKSIRDELFADKNVASEKTRHK